MRKAAKTIMIVLAVLAITSCMGAEAKKDAPMAPDIRTVTLTVPGADCVSTGAAADTLLRGMKGISFVEVDINTATAVIKYDASTTDLESIKRTMKEGDFPVTGVEEME